MKNFTLHVCFVALTFSIFTLIACKKQDQEQNKPIENTIGRWVINRIQLKIYNGNVFVKDSIMPYTAGKNFFTQLDANNSFQFSYNSSVVDNGTYVFKGQDSIIATTPSTVYRWKLLTLTDVLFTTSNVSTNNPGFPGSTVETYYTFTRK